MSEVVVVNQLKIPENTVVLLLLIFKRIFRLFILKYSNAKITIRLRTHVKSALNNILMFNHIHNSTFVVIYIYIHSIVWLHGNFIIVI